MSKCQVIYVMGVSGSGKSTVGEEIAARAGYQFFDGDDFHPPANIAKMASGQPLNDADRAGWLATINAHAAEVSQTRGVVFACSALKAHYREILSKGLESVHWVYLAGSFELISERMSKRTGHFMPAALLRSQFEILEPPTDAIELNIEGTVAQMVAQVTEALQLDG